MIRTAQLQLSPGEAIPPALERAARARGVDRLRFHATSGLLDRVVIGFEDRHDRTYRHVNVPLATLICLDGEIEIDPHGVSARIATVVEDERGTHLSGRLLEGRVGPALELLITSRPTARTDGRREIALTPGRPPSHNIRR